ncbi:MAG: 3-isopropylmalate dehydrogenase [Deltaproteobacteria bacterium]|nr:3-isopropylmalate dehydrogenase [Deltaproteobacteria bacterium]
MRKKVLVMAGDGIGPEVCREAEKVLKAAAAKAGLELTLEEALVGGAALDATGHPLPEESLVKAKGVDGVLLGAVGGPKWDRQPMDLRPEKGLLALREGLELFANLRPARIYGGMTDASTLKPEVVEDTDLMVVRELTGGIYFGQPRGMGHTDRGREAYNTMRYNEQEIERIARIGFDIAGKRKKRLLSVDKANVLEVSALWREVVTELAPQYPDIQLEHMYVDNAAMQLIRAPKMIDTLVTSNLFGDILSDAAAMLTGSIGMLPSASLGKTHALYEPVHGSAPNIAGLDLANPLAAILSAAMMFRYTFDLPRVDEAINRAVQTVLAEYRTADIAAPGKTTVGCIHMGDLVVQALDKAG